MAVTYDEWELQKVILEQKLLPWLALPWSEVNGTLLVRFICLVSSKKAKRVQEEERRHNGNCSNGRVLIT